MTDLECSPYLNRPEITEREDKLLRAAQWVHKWLASGWHLDDEADQEAAERMLAEALADYKDRS